MNKPVTKAELDALELLEKPATPGPWNAWIRMIHPSEINHADGTVVARCFSPDRDEQDCEFLTESRNALPRLIADHRRLVESNAALLEIIRQASRRCNSGQDHECGWSPQSEKHIAEAAEYLRQWEGTK